MRGLAISIGALGAATFGATLLSSGSAVTQDMSFSQIEQGRYLTTISNCAGCHTDFENGGAPFAGGRELETPFGVIYSPNITPDDETGIGRWSREDFYNALHEGVDPEGRQIYPAMPYPHFTLMPREDVDAIYDYLRIIEPVTAETPENELPFPLNVREAVIGWKTLYFEAGEFVPNPDMPAEWNRGAYLVDGPAHCGGCHTDKNLAGADDEDEYLRGGVLENWHAPNIRGGENGGIADWSVEDIVAFLGTGRNDHTAAMMRMGEVVLLSTQHMHEADLEAIAIYLKSLDDAPREVAAMPDQAVMDAGAAIYFDNCAACHATDGSGAPGIFAPLDGSNKINSDDPTTIIRLVLEGARAVPTETHPGPLGMPAFGWKLTDEQVADLLSYVRNSWSNNATVVSADEVSGIRELLE